jgi:hypothetical protein
MLVLITYSIRGAGILRVGVGARSMARAIPEAAIATSVLSVLLSMVFGYRVEGA